jgi:polysaccharide export outer membrane protein
MMVRLFSCLAVAATLAGCAGAGEKFVGRPDLALVDASALPAPSREDLVVPARPYAIGPTDQLAIDVFGVPEVSRTVTVDLGGRIALPLAGTMVVSGLNSGEVADLVVERLRRDVRNPRVSVNVIESANQVVTIDGAVKTPGVYPVQGRMSLMRAIARAQGTTEFTRENHVVVFRRSNGRDYATLYDLRAIRQGIFSDPEIYSNDVIVVGESNARRIFRDVLAASGLITAPIVAIIR